ncbi:uncharacterized protein VICG_00011 [Vittaforma corneae ATCC 50505]|uniref:DNA mismatch repair proteins mutS family domain-containing protein n=1 Tax=Vittaforma corneae (strain ATCC 50505) TaxID=993615 RepID=L2GPE3_VITCO|nr:uncharacterized protein VICG_00011 [Vittaforma corneae ATCC 50505]ELA42696.1 hypothetical protein VICG_00011 [Vittaforma corneae ATCC 50505]
MFSKEIQFKRPRIENKVSIHNVSHVLFPEFQRSSYLFENNEVYVITGANMAGKSCYLRNLFHIAILSKIGCFIDCDSAEVPAFDEMYFINSIEDVNILTQKILKKTVSIEENYKTPERLVLIDELHCCSKIQLNLLLLLKNSRILTLFVTHRTELIDKLKDRNFKIFSYENFQLKEGVNNQSNVLKICERHFPEILQPPVKRMHFY